MDFSKLPVASVDGGKYRLIRRLGKGSFGDVYLGTSQGMDVAIKVESMTSKIPMLLHEAKVYGTLAGSVGIPKLLWYGTEGKYNAIVLDLLGQSFEDLFNCCNGKFSLKTVLMCADQSPMLLIQIFMT